MNDGTRVPRHEETADYWRAMHDEQVRRKHVVGERLTAVAHQNEQLRRAIGDALYLIEDSHGTPRPDNVVEVRNVLATALDHKRAPVQEGDDG